MKMIVCLLFLLLCACVSKSLPQEPPESPYKKKALVLTLSGQQAMQQQHWMQAKSLFYRSKSAAELADDRYLISSSWYNIAMAHVGAGHQEHALYAFEKAKNHASEVDLMRICLARLLLTKSQDSRWLNDFDSMHKRWRLDIVLSAARLAQQQHLPIAESFYLRVLKEAKADQQGLLYQAQAALGLALIHRKTQTLKARDYAHKSLNLLHQLAQPALNAHVLWLLSRLEENDLRQRDFAQRACLIYLHLKDQQGISTCQKEGVRP
ncbi:MAG: hypothetical protein Q9M28_10810 [Mariprofundaceae bacterium]|nr:hypothetical protein [Mariprofundaceae bacterium]